MRQGEISQYTLIPMLLQRGLEVSLPCNPESIYDLVVDNGARLLKVQVKSCNVKKRNRYRVDIAHGTDRNKRSYSVGSFDFFVVHIPNEAAWYVVPLADVLGRRWMSLYPHDKCGIHDKYREAWGLLHGKQD